MLSAGSILQNRYRVVRQLGAGGMGAIYEAVDQRVSCVVVIKETLVGPNSDARQAFQREAALLANLRHAALPKVMDYFGEAEGEFLVMEYIAGRDLAELLEEQAAPFSEEQVLVWADQLLKLLEYLHTRDPPIIHRDIKPANLKITAEGEIFLLDFGLAKGAAGQMTTVRTDGSVYGYTPLYAPLEQIHGQGTDPRSDIYSLGATLYDALAGQPPVSAPTRFDAIDNDRPDPLPLVNKLNSRVSSALAEVIRKAMAMSRRDRFHSAAEMRAAIAQAREAAASLEAARHAAEKLINHERAEPDPDRPLVADDNVQFTVYSPRQIKPKKTYTMLAFAHLSKKRDDAPEDEPDPIALVKDQAARILGPQQADYDDAKDESSQPVPREGELLFVPLARGITFSPPSRSFTWRKSVHREEFDLWASADLDGETILGTLTVFLGSLVIAEVPLKIAVDSRAESSAEKVSLESPQTGRRVRQIFASYSPQDEQIVNELAQVAPIFGSRFVMDRTHLEPGEDRREGLQRLIRGADVFQLFWSTNSMHSADTAEEINYARSLGRAGFILPTYWEEPLPKDPAAGLPPPDIARLQFHRIYPGAISSATAEQRKSRVVILAPTGAEVFINDERRGSIGSSGRLVVSSIPPGKHVMRVVCAGYRDDERVIEVREGGDEQIFLGRFKARDRLDAAPDTVSQSLAAGPTLAPQAFTVSGEREKAVNTGALPAAPADRDTKPLAAPPELLAPTHASRSTVPSPDRPTTLNETAMPDARPAPTVAFGSPPSPSHVVLPNYELARPRALPAARPAGSKKWLTAPVMAGVAMVLFLAIAGPVYFVLNLEKAKSSLPASGPRNSNSIATANRNANINGSVNGPPHAAGIEFVPIPAGKFMMGSENGLADQKPVHEVTLSTTQYGGRFYLGKYEVTQAQWQSVMGNNPSRFKDCGSSCPVDHVSWDDAQEFVKKLNEKMDGYTYRLPSESEWEYACRANSRDDAPGNLDTMAWYFKNSDRPHPVGRLSPNAFGLFDMQGNVQEWCQDWYHNSYSSVHNDGGPYLYLDELQSRVLRGGAFSFQPHYVSCTARSYHTPDVRNDFTGLRVAAVRQ